MFTTISPNLFVHPPTLKIYSDSTRQDEHMVPTLTFIGTQMTSESSKQVNYTLTYPQETMFTTVSSNLLVHSPTFIIYSDSTHQDEDIEPTPTFTGTQEGQLPIMKSTLLNPTAEPTHTKPCLPRYLRIFSCTPPLL
jgi:hypothetical protein